MQCLHEENKLSLNVQFSIIIHCMSSGRHFLFLGKVLGKVVGRCVVATSKVDMLESVVDFFVAFAFALVRSAFTPRFRLSLL